MRDATQVEESLHRVLMDDTQIALLCFALTSSRCYFEVAILGTERTMHLADHFGVSDEECLEQRWRGWGFERRTSVG